MTDIDDDDMKEVKHPPSCLARLRRELCCNERAVVATRIASVVCIVVLTTLFTGISLTLNWHVLTQASAHIAMALQSTLTDVTSRDLGGILSSISAQVAQLAIVTPLLLKNQTASTASWTDIEDSIAPAYFRIFHDNSTRFVYVADCALLERARALTPPSP